MTQMMEDFLMKAFALSLSALFILTLAAVQPAAAKSVELKKRSAGPSAKHGPGVGKHSPGLRKHRPGARHLPHYRRCFVRWYGRGFKCFRSRYAAYRYARMLRRFGMRVRISGHHGRICLRWYGRGSRVFSNSYSARRFSYMLRRLGIRSYVRCFPYRGPRTLTSR